MASCLSPFWVLKIVPQVLPDLNLICEIMLMAEGFQMSKILSRKFVILYKLCEDLLSKSRHYDWKLRAIKTTLYVAGGMKRDAPELSEDKVTIHKSNMRASMLFLSNSLTPQILIHFGFKRNFALIQEHESSLTLAAPW